MAGVVALAGAAIRNDRSAGHASPGGGIGEGARGTSTNHLVARPIVKIQSRVVEPRKTERAIHITQTILTVGAIVASGWTHLAALSGDPHRVRPRRPIINVMCTKCRQSASQQKSRSKGLLLLLLPLECNRRIIYYRFVVHHLRPCGEIILLNFIKV